MASSKTVAKATTLQRRDRQAWRTVRTVLFGDARRCLCGMARWEWTWTLYANVSASWAAEA
jgi:hypothetical protein